MEGAQRTIALEDRLRSMMISAQGSEQPTRSEPRRHGRPNQAQRRKMAAHGVPTPVSQPLMSATQSYSVDTSSTRMKEGRNGFNTDQGYQSFKAHHLRPAAPESPFFQEGLRDMRMHQTNFPQQPGYKLPAYGHPANGFSQRHAEFSRPHPQHSQLYNPSSNVSLNLPYHHRDHAAMKAQMGYLDHIVYAEASTFTLTSEELAKKELLKIRLRDICRSAIIQHERSQNINFDITSVDLQCFGSVGTGYAMPNSDMDLALLSPGSTPDPRSSESVIPRLLEKALLDAGFGARLLTKTRVPIIRFCEKPSEELHSGLVEARSKWEAEEQGKVQRSESNSKNKTATEQADSNINGASDTPPEVSSPANDEIRLRKGKNAQPKKAGPSCSAEQTAQKDAKALGTDIKGDQQPKKEETQPKIFSIETEGEDGDAPARSDEERIRLYKLAIQDGWYLPPERVIIRRFIESFRKSALSDDTTELDAARKALEVLPNILKRHREHNVNPLDFPKNGVGIQCDINFSNFLALHNTKLLYCYSLCDPRVKTMVLFVKRWAKRRKINSPYHGTLSSYGYVLMVLHYLINVAKPPVLPNLQHVPAGRIESADNPSQVEGYDARFWRDELAIMATAQSGRMNSNTESTGSLLRGFFQYFGTGSPQSFDWMTQVLSLRTIGGIVTKASKGWTGAKTTVSEGQNEGDEKKEVRHRYLFAIEDPFEVDHNIARTVVHNGIVAIRDEFRRAVRVIGSVRYEGCMAKEDLLAEAEDREHLQHKPFGHPPKWYGQAISPLVANKQGKKAEEILMNDGRRTALTHSEAAAKVADAGEEQSSEESPRVVRLGAIRPVDQNDDTVL